MHNVCNYIGNLLNPNRLYIIKMLAIEVLGLFIVHKYIHVCDRVCGKKRTLGAKQKKMRDFGIKHVSYFLYCN